MEPVRRDARACTPGGARRSAPPARPSTARSATGPAMPAPAENGNADGLAARWSQAARDRGPGLALALTVAAAAGFLSEHGAAAMPEVTADASRWMLITATAALGAWTSLKAMVEAGPRHAGVIAAEARCCSSPPSASCCSGASWAEEIGPNIRQEDQQRRKQC